ncbi:5-deoxy-glucuronate isomerase [Desulfobaculum bizertense]|uniref:5-deoxyglucuronate isomerase n=1 Tax=Desulfobaculum bizertense DSM 18034 TaxID=1121442 RepID=A0A1T4VQ61_9BACT|nr:5-deoxy-glucuronate isomerase [Desulfobaculum bizertense]SKA67087.1 5-deoxyglucuronate isomerase [Desulfobaculum bizertense DSM 18034]
MTYTTLHRFKDVQGYESVITPENSTVEHMEFGRILVDGGTGMNGSLEGKEMALVIMEGDMDVHVSFKGQEYDYKGITRGSVFDEKPTAIYLPPHCEYSIVSQNGVEVRTFCAYCDDGNEPYLCTPDNVEEGIPGAEKWRRKYRFIFGPKGMHNDHVTQKLIVGESVSRPGGWIGFPGHKHDIVADNEYPLDEIFSFKVKGPKGGYVFAMSYELEPEKFAEVHLIEDDKYAMGIAKGYHTSLAAPGCTEFLLWGLAGDAKTYKLVYDERFDWMDHAEFMETF